MISEASESLQEPRHAFTHGNEFRRHLGPGSAEDLSSQLIGDLTKPGCRTPAIGDHLRDRLVHGKRGDLHAAHVCECDGFDAAIIGKPVDRHPSQHAPVRGEALLNNREKGRQRGRRRPIKLNVFSIEEDFRHDFVPEENPSIRDLQLKNRPRGR